MTVRDCHGHGGQGLIYARLLEFRALFQKHEKPTEDLRQKVRFVKAEVEIGHQQVSQESETKTVIILDKRTDSKDS